jgi:hypothetical protein
MSVIDAIDQWLRVPSRSPQMIDGVHQDRSAKVETSRLIDDVHTPLRTAWT